MAAKNPHRLQNEFLTHLIKERTPVTIFLLNGVKLQGNISSFDDFCISLAREGQVQAVYKQEISTIATSSPVTLWEDPDAPPTRKPPPRSAPKAAPRKLVVERVRRIPSTRSR
jgi:host factor-I protein